MLFGSKKLAVGLEDSVSSSPVSVLSPFSCNIGSPVLRFSSCSVPVVLQTFCPIAPHGSAVRDLPLLTSLTSFAAGKLVSDINTFRLSLSVSDRDLFDSGHRLSLVDRQNRLRAISPETIRSKGIRFSDEVSLFPGPVVSDVEKLRLEKLLLSAPLAKPSTYLPKSFLMTLWHFYDPLLLELIVDGIVNGVNMCYDGQREIPTVVSNMKSALEHLDVVAELVQREINLGWTRGWFAEKTFVNLFVSSIGIVPKVDVPAGPDDWRIIKDLSRPLSTSINDSISKLVCNYSSFDDIVYRFVQAGRGCWILKFDIFKAFPSICVRQQDLHLCGIFVQDLGYAICNRLVEGSRSSPSIFERYGDCFVFVFKVETGIAVLRYVDDFIIFLICSYEEAVQIKVRLNLCALRHGILFHPEKWVGPVQSAPFVGFQWNSSDLTISVPLAKLVKYKARFTSLLALDSWTLKQTQSVLGALFHLSRVIIIGRSFLGRLLCFRRSNFASNTPSASAVVPAWAKDDLRWWLNLLSFWKGVKPVRLIDPGFAQDGTGADVIFVLDASPKYGRGIFCVSHGFWLSVPFSAAELAVAKRDITHSSTFLEAFPALDTLATFNSFLSHRNVVFRIDNEPVRLALQKGYAKEPSINELVRLAGILAAVFDIHLTFLPIRSLENRLADSLSHNDIQAFREEIGKKKLFAQSSPTPVRSVPAMFLQTSQLFFYSMGWLPPPGKDMKQPNGNLPTTASP